MSLTMKRRVTVLATAISVLLIASIAFAAWTANGAGSGTAKAGTHTELTTTAATTAGDLLYPGGSGDVKLTINNANPYDVAVSEINGDGAITSNDGACTITGVSFEDRAGSWTVPAGESLDVTLEDAASMNNDSVSACQGDIFTIPVAIVGLSAE